MTLSAQVRKIANFRSGFLSLIPLLLVGSMARPLYSQVPPGPGRPMTVRSDIQEADSKTGIITARGNVQINYPARQMQATAAQAQYFSRERRIVLKGNVFVIQEGNTIRGETVTYLIDEGRFIAIPANNQSQVESIYILRPGQEPTVGPIPGPGPR